MPTHTHPVAWLLDDWQAFLADKSEPRFRALQVFRWIHARGVMDADAMSDLPKRLRAELAQAGLASPFTLESTHTSEDGARKLVLRARDGALVETVLLPSTAKAAVDDADHAAVDEEIDSPEAESLDDGDPFYARGPFYDREVEQGAAPEEIPASVPPSLPTPHVRVTQCISTQVGCAMGCRHCASGQGGLLRQLAPEEIVAQVLFGLRALEPNERLRNVLFMGMGEPLHNYEATARALELLLHPEGLKLGPRRLTVSTVGLVPEIERLSNDFGGKIGLAVSLHGGTDQTRISLAPIGRRYLLRDVVGALRRYRLPMRRRITIEYTLVAGHNDSVDEAAALARLLRDVRVKVNLIPLNPIPNSPLAPASAEAVAAFQKVLVDAGLLCFVRRRRGDDVSAACGQLARALSRDDIERKQQRDARQAVAERRVPKEEPRLPKGPRRNPKEEPRLPKGPRRNPKEEPRLPKGPRRNPKEEPRLPKGPRRSPKEEPRLPKGPRRAPKEEPRFPKGPRRAPKEEPRLPKGPRRAPKEEPRFPKGERLPPRDDRRAPKDDRRAPRNDRRASKDDRRASKDDRRASKDDRRAPRNDRRAPKDDRGPPRRSR